MESLRFGLFRSLICVLAIVTLGCSEAGTESFEAVPEQTRKHGATLQDHSFDSLVQLKFVTVTPSGPVEVRTEEEVKQVLARYSSESRRGQEDEDDFETETAYQQINPYGSNRFFMESAEKPANVPHVMYNNRSPNMGGIFLNSDGHSGIPTGPGTFSGQVTWWYGQIDGTQSDGNIGVVMTNPWRGGPSILSGGEGIIEVVMDYTLVFTETHVTYNVTASIDDTEVFSVSGLKRPLPATYQGLDLPIAPVFASPTSGTFAIEMNNVDDNDWYEPNGGLTYWIQRGMTLEQPLQNFTLLPGDPAVFSNSFQWDFGDNRSSLQNASWDIKITAPGGDPVTTLSGTGRTVSASWDTTALTGAFRLKPKGQDSPDGGTPIYAYEIVMRALAYDDASPDHRALGATPNGPLLEIPFNDVFYEVSTAEPTTEVKIINSKLEPEPPFQNEDDTVELTADIITVGLDNLSANDIEWWVELLDPDGQPVGDPLATGNGFNVEATWDGKVNGLDVVDPRSYTLRVSATACPSVSQQRGDIRAQQACPPVARADVELSGPRMVVSGIVVENNGGSTTEIEKRVGVGFRPAVLGANGAKDLQRMRREFLGRVQTLRVSPNGGYDVDLEVQVEYPEGVDPPAKLLLQAKNMLTGEIDASIEADQDSIDYGGFVYKVTSVNLPTAFINADSFDDTDASTRFSVGELYRDKSKFVGSALLPGKKGQPGVTSGVTEAFLHLMENSLVFPGPKLFLGRFAETAIDADQELLSEVYPDKATAPLVSPDLTSNSQSDKDALEILKTVTSDPRNLVTTGFVPIEFTVRDDSANKNPMPLSPVYVKVPRLTEPSSRKANVVLWTYHGRHDGTLGASEDRDRVMGPAKNWTISPSTLGMAESLESVHTLILTSCDALDINDYNNGKVLRAANGDPIPGVYPGANQRTFGGELWDQVMATTTKSLSQEVVLLGYNDISPLIRDDNGQAANSMTDVIVLFEQELENLTQVPLEERRQLAWMSANVKFAATSTTTGDARWTSLHATAIDKDYYYYIPQEKDRNHPIKVNGLTIAFATKYSTVKRNTPVYRVARYPVWPPGQTPQTLPSGATPEWGVYAPGIFGLDLGDYDDNRDNFAEPVSIPGLTYPPGLP